MERLLIDQLSLSQTCHVRLMTTANMSRYKKVGLLVSKELALSVFFIDFF